MHTVNDIIYLRGSTGFCHDENTRQQPGYSSDSVTNE